MSVIVFWPYVGSMTSISNNILIQEGLEIRYIRIMHVYEEIGQVLYEPTIILCMMTEAYICLILLFFNAMKSNRTDRQNKH